MLAPAFLIPRLAKCDEDQVRDTLICANYAERR
jgi:hypothetical protein